MRYIVGEVFCSLGVTMRINYQGSPRSGLLYALWEHVSRDSDSAVVVPAGEITIIKINTKSGH